MALDAAATACLPLSDLVQLRAGKGYVDGTLFSKAKSYENEPGHPDLQLRGVKFLVRGSRQTALPDLPLATCSWKE